MNFYFLIDRTIELPKTDQPCTIIAVAIMNLVATHPKSTMSSEVLPSESPLNFDRLNPLRSARALQPVLQLLRSQYASGCLTAELVQVVHDQFVVQAKVQVEGVAIVTALASASTVEVAEDRARTRVLESLGLSSIPSHALSNTLSNTLSNPLGTPLSATLPLMPEVVLPEVVSEQVELEVAPAVEPQVGLDSAIEAPMIEEPIVEEPIVEEPKVTKTSTKRKSKAAAPVVVEEPTLEIALEMAPEPEVLVEPEAIAEASQVEVPQVEMPQAEMPQAEMPQEEETFEVTFEGGDEAEVEYEYSFEEEVTPEVAPMATPAMAATPVMPEFTLDLSDAIAQIGSEIDRIGWTKKQGSGYLQDTYGKRTRAELTETELFNFLAYLKSLPAKVQPDLSALPF